ncbi:MAG TPA: dihydroorotase [Syntrophales bacterium]|nr:dihydroorotase [Syntrophales bacterium]
MTVLLKGGRVIDPSQKMDDVLDVLVENGKVAAVGRNLGDDGKGKKKDPGLTILELKGKLVVPGLIDIHTHLREPGYEYKETVESGCQAAVAGGFTSIACMPNTNPINDNRSVTEFVIRQAQKANLANVYPIAAISMGSEGKILTEFGDLREAGAAGFSDDGKPVIHAGLMKRALEYAYSIELPIVSHCEELQLSKGGLMNEGLVSTELGMTGIPTISEDIPVMRDILIAEYVGTSIHICHVSSTGAVRIIRQAKERGVKVTAETAPQYLLLTDEALKGFETSYKVNPPLRSAEDVAAVRAGLRDGTIDVIASDHAPHSPIEKDVEFEYAASGMVGLETSLGLCWKLVEEGLLTPSELIARMTVNAARVLRIPGGTLKKGAPADVTVIDPKKAWTVDVKKFRSKSRNSPFDGWKLPVKAVLTMVGGEIKYNEL